MSTVHEAGMRIDSFYVKLNSGSVLRRVLNAAFQQRSDRRQARMLEDVLRKMDTHMLCDIGLREILEEARKSDSRLPKPVLMAVSRLFPTYRR